MLPHTNGDVCHSITTLNVHYSLRMERSGCCLSIPKLQLGGADLNCSPSFLPNVVIARDAAAAIFGNLYILRIALALITVPSVRVRHDAEFFLGAGGSAVGRETACGITRP